MHNVTLRQNLQTFAKESYNKLSIDCLGPLPPPISGSSPTEPLIPTVSPSLHQSAFRPVIRGPPVVEPVTQEPPFTSPTNNEDNSDDEVDIETTEDDPVTSLNITTHNLHSVSKSTTSSHSGRNSPQCWSPPRETVSSLSLSTLIFARKLQLVRWNSRCISDIV